MDLQEASKARARGVLTLALGDAGVYLAATLAGFASHQELEMQAAGRMAATWVPFTGAWLLAALLLGLLRPELARSYRSLPRVIAAALAAAPLGAWLRSLWLRSDIVPIFVLVMAAVSLVGLLSWRAFYARVARRAGG